MNWTPEEKNIFERFKDLQSQKNETIYHAKYKVEITYVQKKNY